MRLTFSTGTGTDDATGRHARVRRRGRVDPWPAEPLWPAPDPARDREIMRDLASGEAGAEARLYDAYAARLHDYAASVLREGPAADVVHDVLVDAARRAARARDRERLGAWLYGATRARIRRRTFPRPHWDWSAAPGETRPAVPARVRDALDHLMAVTGPTERELLLLTGRHGLTMDDLEGVLGRPARGLRRRCVLAWRRAAEIVAAHAAVPPAADGALRASTRPTPSPHKVSGSTPPNGLPYVASDPARQMAYPLEGAAFEELPFPLPGFSSGVLPDEPEELLFGPYPPAGYSVGPYEAPRSGDFSGGDRNNGRADAPQRPEAWGGVTDSALSEAAQSSRRTDSVVWRHAKRDAASGRLSPWSDAQTDSPAGSGPWASVRRREPVEPGAWPDGQRREVAASGTQGVRDGGADGAPLAEGRHVGGDSWMGAEAEAGVVDPALRVEALLVAPAVPAPPQRLRMRVLHTLADPELAPYRAEISARGGRLTPEGLPRQVDATSPVIRRTRRAGLRTTLTGAAAVTGVRTSAAATATVGTALVPLFLVPASTPTTGVGLAPGGHGGHSIASPLSGDLPEPLPAKVAHGSGSGVLLPAGEVPDVVLTPPQGAGAPAISETPKYPEVPAISGGVPSGPVLPGVPVQPPVLPVPGPLPGPLTPPPLLQAVPQIVDAVPQVVRDVPGVVQDLPRVVQAVPRVVQAVPEIVRDLPQTVEDVPRTLQDVPKVVQDVPRVVQDLPTVVQDVPKAISGLTGSAMPSGRDGGADASGASGGGRP